MSNPARVFVRLKTDRLKVKKLVSSGIESVRVIKRAQVLLLSNEKKPSPIIAQYIGVSPETARRIIHRYNEGGLEHALYERPRGKHTPIFNQKSGSNVIAMVCSDPPAGRARWTLKLIASEAVRRKIIPKVGKETIRKLLRSHDLKPWREKNVVRAHIDVRVHRKNGRLVRFVRQRTES